MRVINIMIRISITSIDFNHNLAGFQKKMEFVNDIEPWLALFEKNFINLSSSHESYSFSSSHQNKHHAVTIPGAPITTNYRLRQKSRFGSASASRHSRSLCV